ncbi:hypothetical protein [Vibrio fortis]|uniref:hypothetical protein n=1 Tax=Vibrio fortis TaxID=212667 RepID=UPI003EBF1BDD
MEPDTADNHQPIKFNDQWLKTRVKCINDNELHFYPATTKGKNHLIQTMKTARLVTWYSETGEFMGNFSAKGFTAMWDEAVFKADVARNAI